MSREQLVKDDKFRIPCGFTKIISGRTGGRRVAKIINAMAPLSQASIFIDDTAAYP